MPDLTNPPVPATPLDVEACVRLLTRLAITFMGNAEAACELAENPMYGDRRASYLAEAREIYADVTTLRALASALPGMGKAEERLRRIREQCRVIYYGTTDMYPIEHAPGANKDSWEWMMLHLDADAARAAQPEETSDGR